MAVKDWHAGKLVVVWATVGFLLLLSSSYVDWFVIAFPFGIAAIIVTWIWLSGREEKK